MCHHILQEFRKCRFIRSKCVKPGEQLKSRANCLQDSLWTVQIWLYVESQCPTQKWILTFFIFNSYLQDFPEFSSIHLSFLIKKQTHSTVLPPLCFIIQCSGLCAVLVLVFTWSIFRGIIVITIWMCAKYCVISVYGRIISQMSYSISKQESHIFWNILAF